LKYRHLCSYETRCRPLPVDISRTRSRRFYFFGLIKGWELKIGGSKNEKMESRAVALDFPFFLATRCLLLALLRGAFLHCFFRNFFLRRSFFLRNFLGHKRTSTKKEKQTLQNEQNTKCIWDQFHNFVKKKKYKIKILFTYFKNFGILDKYLEKKENADEFFF
jgi:hypothetical protein